MINVPMDMFWVNGFIQEGIFLSASIVGILKEVEENAKTACIKYVINVVNLKFFKVITNEIFW